jgi:hypothetical protein
MILSAMAGVIASSVMFLILASSALDASKEGTLSVDDVANAEMAVLAYTVLGYIRDDDFIALSRVVHPEYGVVLSPYATINLTTDRHFSAEQIATLDADTNVYVWGVYNGSGEPIKLTTVEFLEKFVPAADHLEAVFIGINQIVRSGNALENITEIFPNAKFVDFYLPGEAQFEASDWSSLRLGFEDYDGDLRLVVISYSKRMD